MCFFWVELCSGICIPFGDNIFLRRFPLSSFMGNQFFVTNLIFIKPQCMIGTVLTFACIQSQLWLVMVSIRTLEINDTFHFFDSQAGAHYLYSPAISLNLCLEWKELYILQLPDGSTASPAQCICIYDLTPYTPALLPLFWRKDQFPAIYRERNYPWCISTNHGYSRNNA